MLARASTGSRSRHSTTAFSPWLAPGCFSTATTSTSPVASSRRPSRPSSRRCRRTCKFLSLTFVGMTLGSLITDFVGDKMGRRFTYQINLLVFGLASLAAAFAQDMTQLIVCRFIQGLGLGAEIVVGYSTMTEFVPPKTRGRWLAFMAFIVVAGFPATAIL